jgi:hypothetical protein
MAAHGIEACEGRGLDRVEGIDRDLSSLQSFDSQSDSRTDDSFEDQDQYFSDEDDYSHNMP